METVLELVVLVEVLMDVGFELLDDEMGAAPYLYKVSCGQ